MPDNNQFQPYRYQQPGERQTPHQPLNISAGGSRYGEEPGMISKLMRRPAVATALLLVAAGVLAGVFMLSYPGSSDDQGNLPVIKADASSVKMPPENFGGMDIPNADSTIFQTGSVNEAPPVENLLEDEPPVSKLEAFAEEAKDMMQEEKPADLAEVDPDAAAAAAAEPVEEKAPEAVSAAPVEDKKEEVAVAAEPSEDVLQDITPEVPAPAAVPGMKARVAEKAAAPAVRAEDVYTPGSSPETLAFVRSVLDKKDDEPKKEAAATNSAKDDAEIVKGEAIAEIQPAAGNSASAIKPGNYYVQLVSVTSQSGAHTEWTKLQKTYSALKGADYRVQETNLGERGTYYRVQAGPMSKGSADDICSKIKAQKPGGCLVVK